MYVGMLNQMCMKYKDDLWKGGGVVNVLSIKLSFSRPSWNFIESIFHDHERNKILGRLFEEFK